MIWHSSPAFTWFMAHRHIVAARSKIQHLPKRKQGRDLNDHGRLDTTGEDNELLFAGNLWLLTLAPQVYAAPFKMRTF
jgi:hypothetical protein